MYLCLCVCLCFNACVHFYMLICVATTISRHAGLYSLHPSSLIALTQLTYQTTFAPMIFWIFLSRFFRTSPQYKRFDQKKKMDTRRSVSDDDSLTVKMDKRRTTSQSSNLTYGTPYQTSHISPSPQASPRSSPVPSSIDHSIRSRSFENSFY